MAAKNWLRKKIQEDKDFFKKLKEQTDPQFKELRASWLTKEESIKEVRSRLTKKIGVEWFKTLGGEFKKQQTPTEEVTETPTDTTITETTPIDTTWWADITETPTWVDITWAEEEVTDEWLTLRQKVAEQVATRQTKEEALIAWREEAWRAELIEQRKAFREEAASVQEDLANITKGLEAEWWAITKIAASRIREARSAPLRETLTALVKWQELTAASITELDTSIEAILEARTLDREDAAKTLAAQIEASDLSDAEKNRLLWEIQVKTDEAKRRDEIETFRQKEEIKANIEKADIESLEKTWLTAEQALQSAKITEAFDVKEDSIAWQAIRKLLKEWKTPDQINQILGLAEKDWVIDDETFTRQEKLRKEFEASATVKNYLEATQQFAWVISSLWTATWPWDMAAIFAFMKTLDPSSVVRESEFDAAARSIWLWEQAKNFISWDKLVEWVLLTKKWRKTFAEIAKVLFENRKSAFDERAGKFITLSKEAWANPKSVVLDFEKIPWFASDLTEEDFAPVGADSSDDEIKRMLRKTWNTLNKDSSDEEIDNFLDSTDEGLDSADQSAIPKGTADKSINILWDLKAQILPKGWANPILWLRGWSLTFRTNNPLAITATSAWSANRLTNKFWALNNIFSPDSLDNLVLNFSTVEEWLAAWRQLLEEKRELTLNKLAESHTWTSAEWHKAQLQKHWLSLNTKFKDLTEEQKNAVIESFKIAEWFTKWEIIS